MYFVFTQSRPVNNLTGFSEAAPGLMWHVWRSDLVFMLLSSAIKHLRFTTTSRLYSILVMWKRMLNISWKHMKRLTQTQMPSPFWKKIRKNTGCLASLKVSHSFEAFSTFHCCSRSHCRLQTSTDIANQLKMPKNQIYGITVCAYNTSLHGLLHHYYHSRDAITNSTSRGSTDLCRV